QARLLGDPERSPHVRAAELVGSLHVHDGDIRPHSPDMDQAKPSRKGRVPAQDVAAKQRAGRQAGDMPRRCPKSERDRKIELIAHRNLARDVLLARAPVAVAEALRHIAHPSRGHAADAARADQLIEKRVRDGPDELEVAPAPPDDLVSSGKWDERLQCRAHRDRRAVRDEALDGLGHRRELARQRPMDSTYERWLRPSSSIDSPPNFSRNASASVSATIASPITPAAGTTHTSLRS